MKNMYADGTDWHAICLRRRILRSKHSTRLSKRSATDACASQKMLCAEKSRECLFRHLDRTPPIHCRAEVVVHELAFRGQPPAFRHEVANIRHEREVEDYVECQERECQWLQILLLAVKALDRWHLHKCKSRDPTIAHVRGYSRRLSIQM